MERDNFARTISLISLVLGVLSLGFTYYQYQEGRTEKLSINILTDTTGYNAKITDMRIGDKIVLQSAWEVTISNNSSRPVSIIDYDINGIKKEGPGNFFFSGIDGGAFDSKSQLFELPWNIEAGKGIRFFLYIGELAVKESLDIVQGLDHEDNRFSFQSLTTALAKRGTDIYGNKVSFTRFGDKEESYIFTMDTFIDYRYIIGFDTGYGETFTVVTSRYQDVESRIQR